MAMQHAPQEQRSFEPIEKDPPVKTRPVSIKGASLQSLARAANDHHRCLDATQTDVQVIKADQALMKRVLDGLAKRAGVPTTDQVASGTDPQPHRSLASIRPWQAAVGVAAIVGGAQGLPIIVKLFGPPLVAFVHALTSLS